MMVFTSPFALFVLIFGVVFPGVKVIDMTGATVVAGVADRSGGAAPPETGLGQAAAGVLPGPGRRGF